MLLEVRNLSIEFHGSGGSVRAVDRLSYDLSAGSVLGIIGESGSGKSVAQLSLLGLLGASNVEISGTAELDGAGDLLKMNETELRKIRGKRIGMIFQDPFTALHPMYTVGAQIVEAIRAHESIPRSAARARAIELLEEVRVPAAANRLDSYPHEFSGGMRQRVVIAIALAQRPDILIADEPTTALDVTVQAQILELLAMVRERFHVAIVLISHDLGVVREVSDSVLVMYGGRATEYGTAKDLFSTPAHPYTWGLMRSIPPTTKRVQRLTGIPGSPSQGAPDGGGCPFLPRCVYAIDECGQQVPELTDHGFGHPDACILEKSDRIKAFNRPSGTESERVGSV
jgi:peptide/nickel transport system ATP-binding protein